VARTPKPLPELSWLKPRLGLSYALAIASFLGLFGLLLVWNLFYAQLPDALFWPVLAFQLVPMLILAPGVLLGNARGHAWACFVINIYFIQGVLAAFDPSRRWFGWAEAILTFVFFCAALLYVRWRFQYNRKQAGEA
jgi:uncharacterized membrane protein